MGDLKLDTLQIIDGDILFDSVNRPVTVSGPDKLTQLVQEILMIETQSNGLGASLLSDPLGVKMAITSAISRYKQLQDHSVYKRDDSELLASISKLLIATKQTSVLFDLFILSNAGQTLLISQEV